jgi:general secretion pathway protein B
MSYILDALKKAERERGIAQIPTLATVHDVHETRRYPLWMLAVAILIFLSTGLWYLTSLQKEPIHTSESVPDRATGQQNRPESGMNDFPASTIDTTPRQSYSTESPQSRASDSYPAPQADRTVTGTASGMSSRSVASAPIPTDDASKGASKITRSTRRSASPPAEEPFPTDSFQQPGGPPASHTPSDTGTQKTDLMKALEGMQISILLYSEIPAERLVFINGIKYAEGDTINGVYLLENISPDGAVLSYGGERTSLKLKSD